MFCYVIMLFQLQRIIACNENCSWDVMPCSVVEMCYGYGEICCVPLWVVIRKEGLTINAISIINYTSKGLFLCKNLVRVAWRETAN